MMTYERCSNSGVITDASRGAIVGCLHTRQIDCVRLASGEYFGLSARHRWIESKDRCDDAIHCRRVHLRLRITVDGACRWNLWINNDG